MPIEIRPSDVAAAAAQALRQWGETFGQIAAYEEEKDRVREVNSGLVTLEGFWQKQYEELPGKGFEIQPEGFPTAPAGIAPSIKTLGEVQYSDVLKEHGKAVAALADNIRANVRNKRAREELLQHLAIGAMQQQGRLLGVWKKAAQAHELATLDELTKTEMAQVGKLGSEEVIRRVGAQVQQMVLANMVDEAEASKYMGAVQEQARYAEGYAGALETMNASGLQAGEAWLEKNTPYWDADPATRTKVLQVVRQEWETQGKLRDQEAENAVGADYYAARNSIPLLKAGMDKLGKYGWFDANQQYKWQERYERQLEFVQNKADLHLGALTKGLEDAEKENGYRVGAALEMSILQGDPLSVQIAIVTKGFWPEAGSKRVPISAQTYEALLKRINGIQPQGLKSALQRIEKISDPVEKAKLQVEITRYVSEHPQATDDEIIQAAENLIAPVKDRILNDAWNGTDSKDAEMERNRNALREAQVKKMTEEIDAGRFAGLTRERATDLSIYASYLLNMAQRKYPHLNLIAPDVDSDGAVTGNPGAAVFVDGTGLQYRFKMENGELILYGLLGTRGNRMQKSWQRMAMPKKKTAPPLSPEEELQARRQFMLEH